MRPLAFLSTLASAFVGQRGAPAIPVGNAPRKHDDTPSASGAGTLLVPGYRSFRARRNPEPGEGRPHYITEQHPVVRPLSARLSRVAKKLDEINDAVEGEPRSGKALRRRVRTLQCAAGNLVAKVAHRDVIAARRAA
jgi:hypothetical protein